RPLLTPPRRSSDLARQVPIRYRRAPDLLARDARVERHPTPTHQPERPLPRGLLRVRIRFSLSIQCRALVLNLEVYFTSRPLHVSSVDVARPASSLLCSLCVSESLC